MGGCLPIISQTKRGRKSPCPILGKEVNPKSWQYGKSQLPHKSAEIGAL